MRGFVRSRRFDAGRVTVLAPALGMLLLFCGVAVQAAARDHVLVAGSSTMFPYAAAVSERQPGPGPLVLPMGSGAGIALFCEGLGPATPDVVLASRAMSAGETSRCRAAGVAPLEALEVGRDGIVVVRSPQGPLRAVSRGELWLALAARVPDPAGGRAWVMNPYRTWRDVSADLPATPIRVLGPPATSGTRDAFAALALRPACEAAGPDDEARRQCGEIRRDGAWEDAGEDDDRLVARLQSDPAALGIVGFGALARNPGRAEALCLDGRCPSRESIASGEYPLTRPLFLYVKTAHRSFVPGLDAWVEGFIAPAAVASDGHLAQLGFIAAPGVARALAESLPRPQPASGTDMSLRLAGVVLTLVLFAVSVGTFLARRQAPVNRRLERGVGATLWTSAAVTGALLAVVLAALVVPTVNFFLQVSPLAFLTGTHWSPESAIRATQAMGEGAFGVLPVLLGSVLVAVIALSLAVPLALAAALHGFAWAGDRQRGAWRVGARLAALVPSVVYGLFAALTVGPAVQALAARLGAGAAAESILAVGLVVGIMLLPVLALRIGEALEAVPQVAAESALGLGATRWETLRDIVLPAAAPGIGAAVLLAVSRALGETIIVLMAAGVVASWSLDPLGSTTTLTAQMVALMSGTHELDNVRTQLPFVLGLFLAMIVLPLNAWALHMLQRSDVTPSPVY
jgi:ABC-type phosphate transport system permease subunit/ABC-type phosphate transport system substrate-binding protein